MIKDSLLIILEVNAITGAIMLTVYMHVEESIEILLIKIATIR